MNIGIFTDTYFPQVSGVATSIKTLKNQLEKHGHQVYIFTTTDPHVDKKEYERNIFRFSSIPFISFTDRRIAYRGLFRAYQIAKKLNLNIIHTQTEFSMGIIGKYVARKLSVPCLHTYHTMYEDYLHYIANGKLVKPIHVKEATLAFCHNMSGVIAPSKRVLNTLTNYGVKSPIRVIPTGIDVNQYDQKHYVNVRPKLKISKSEKVLLSVSRVAYEKNIHELIDAMPRIIEKVPNVKLVIVGDGPAKSDLEHQVDRMQLNQFVIFTGEISNDHVNEYYHMANVFVSTSNSESQGLTYIEAMAAGLKVIVVKTPYTDSLLNDKTLGRTFSTEDEYVNDVIKYIKFPERYKLTNPILRQHKLKEISAECFGNRVINFYHASQLMYEDKKSHLGEIDF
ncbi:1,2-diacylglycerol 3-glucosyltransferase [Philodulcilactobacillus myokoensis]|uniref:1,2-diacylglycerol 3-glucosyltransferase n=1 Tax=Philodulcilactobacillus myokoensis TaxID=2929573 RepID=A0A9W6B150_9LACO|nr:glycosyltransferase family 4 protein [Philodulcilactobacillus myokoensis]GLB47042.1 1,2-diacylglycerol 3-glucosyltransferase [Philodulcilactobacillus myokoensis]